ALSQPWAPNAALIAALLAHGGRAAGLGGGLGVPGSALLVDEAVLGQAREHAVQVVLLEPHRAGDLGDGDAGLGAHELERLLGARPAALGPAAPAAARAAAGSAARRATR